MNATLLELMRQRRTIRKFTDAPVDAAAITRILEAGRLAPSGANQQPWLFAVVSGRGHKAKIREACEAADAKLHERAKPWMKAFFDEQEIVPAKPFLTDCPYLVVVFGRRGKPYWKESAWIAIAYMELAAAELGLGTVTYTPAAPGILNRLLNVPEVYRPLAILPIGHPAEEPDAARRARRPLHEIAIPAEDLLSGLHKVAVHDDRVGSAEIELDLKDGTADLLEIASRIAMLQPAGGDVTAVAACLHDQLIHTLGVGDAYLAVRSDSGQTALVTPPEVDGARIQADSYLLPLDGGHPIAECLNTGKVYLRPQGEIDRPPPVPESKTERLKVLPKVDIVTPVHSPSNEVVAAIGVRLPEGRYPSPRDAGYLESLAPFVHAAIDHAKALGRIEQVSPTDPLTGLFRGDYFEGLLAREQERVDRYLTQCSVLLVDADDVRQVNDARGWRAANEGLQDLARMLLATLRRTDVIGRLEGPTFAAVLPDLGNDKLILVAEKVRSAVSRRASLSQPTAAVRFTVSIGAAVYLPGMDRAQFWSRLNKGLVDAKLKGKNRVVVA